MLTKIIEVKDVTENSHMSAVCPLLSAMQFK